MKPYNPTHPRSLQQGVSLVIVMVLLILGTIAVIGSTRIGWLNEIVVSSESDYQRAFAAAEALVRDAERDIRGRELTGAAPCVANAAFVGCRNFGAGKPFFPQDDDDLDLLAARIGAGASVNNCLQGICLPPNVATLNKATWGDDAAVAVMTAGVGDAAVAATYGLYSGAAPAAASNPLLTAVPARGWYWVEVFRYSDAAGIVAAAGDVPIPDKKRPFVYRITAYVQGLKGGTRVWLRSIFVPDPQNQSI
jgi:type IV pilus assembly protein PilX